MIKINPSNKVLILVQNSFILAVFQRQWFWRYLNKKEIKDTSIIFIN